jgi:uncharacterized protein (DUF1330 family)
MSAYFIALRESIHDAEEMRQYAELGPASAKGRTLAIRAAYGRHLTLEGAAFEGAVIIEFPSFAEAEAWYESPEYQLALAHRLRGATYRAFIVDGAAEP